LEAPRLVPRRRVDGRPYWCVLGHPLPDTGAGEGVVAAVGVGERSGRVEVAAPLSRGLGLGDDVPAVGRVTLTEVAIRQLDRHPAVPLPSHEPPVGAALVTDACPQRRLPGDRAA